MKLRIKTYIKSWITGKWSQTGRFTYFFENKEKTMKYIQELKNSSFRLKDNCMTKVSIDEKDFVDLYEVDVG